jgi:hypothetical protein
LSARVINKREYFNEYKKIWCNAREIWKISGNVSVNASPETVGRNLEDDNYSNKKQVLICEEHHSLVIDKRKFEGALFDLKYCCYLEKVRIKYVVGGLINSHVIHKTKNDV